MKKFLLLAGCLVTQIVAAAVVTNFPVTNTPISGLTAATAVTNSDIFPAVISGNTRKVTFSTLTNYLTAIGFGGGSSGNFIPLSNGFGTNTTLVAPTNSGTAKFIDSTDAVGFDVRSWSSGSTAPYTSNHLQFLQAVHSKGVLLASNGTFSPGTGTTTNANLGDIANSLLWSAVYLQNTGAVYAGGTNILANYLNKEVGGTINGAITMNGVSLNVQGGGTIDILNPEQPTMAWRIQSFTLGGAYGFTSNTLIIQPYGPSGFGLRLGTNGTLTPSAEGQSYLGSPLARWSGIYTMSDSTLGGSNALVDAYISRNLQVVNGTTNQFQVDGTNGFIRAGSRIFIATNQNPAFALTYLAMGETNTGFDFTNNGGSRVVSPVIQNTRRLGFEATGLDLSTGYALRWTTDGTTAGNGSLTGPQLVDDGTFTITIKSNINTGRVNATNGFAGPQRILTNAAAINTVQTNTGYGAAFARKAFVSVDVVYTGTAVASRAEFWVSNVVAGWVKGPVKDFPALTALTVAGTNSITCTVGSGEHFYVTNIANCTAERTVIFEQ